MAVSRLLPGIVGSWNILVPGTPIPQERRYDDTGIETLLINNPSGDHHSPNAFQMTRTQVSGGLMTGSFRYSPTEGRVVTAPYPTPIYDERRRAPPSFSLPNDLASKLFAQANPVRPEILLPVFLSELREFPGMIRELGHYNLLKNRFPRHHSGINQTGKMWLSGNFGWAPLVSDLKKLVTFSDSFEKRQNELGRIHQRGGARRKVHLHHDSKPVANSSFAVNLYPDSIVVTASGIATCDVWGTVRITPNSLPDGSPIRQPTPKEVRRAILGLSARDITANVWEALPWSWLIDYFVNVSDFVQAHSAGQMYTFSDACIMTHERMELNSSPKIGRRDAFGSNMFVSAGRIVAERKTRSVVYAPPYPSFVMSPLSGHQLSILGSLAVSRYKP